MPELVQVNAYSTLRAALVPDFLTTAPGQRCILTPDARVDPDLRAHLDAMAAYVARGVAPNPALAALVDHVRHTAWHYTFGVAREQFGELQRWARSANAVTFRADVGLTDPEGRPLLPATPDSPGRVPYLAVAITRHRAQVDLLNRRAIPAPDFPPLVRAESEVLPRDPKQVALRALAVVLSSYFAGAVLTKSAEQLNSADMRRDYPQAFAALTPREQALFETHDRELAQQLQWHQPEAEALLWALHQMPGRLPDAYPAGSDVLRSAFSRPETDFVAQAELRRLPDLLDEAEREATMHAAFAAGVDPAHSGMQPGVVAARHHALSWLLDRRVPAWDKAPDPSDRGR